MMVAVWGHGCGRLLILVGGGGCRCGCGRGLMNGGLGAGSSHRLRHLRCMGCSLALEAEVETSFGVLGEALAS